MEPTGDWEMYTCEMGGEKCMVFARVDLMKEIPDPLRPILVLVNLDVKSRRADGWTDEPETSFLQQVEMNFEAALAKKWNAVYVARYTKGGRRTMAYHVPQKPTREALEPVINKYANGYTFDMEVYDDPDWENYRETLYPNEIAWLEIGNRPVLDRLTNAGDPLTPERHTLHWLNFHEREERDEFIKALESSPIRFDVIEALEPNADSPKFSVRLEHQCAMRTWDLIGAQLPIIRLAQEFRGEYDGFECEEVASE